MILGIGTDIADCVRVGSIYAKHGIFLIAFRNIWHGVNGCPQRVFVEMQCYSVVALAFAVYVEIVFLYRMCLCCENISLCQVSFRTQNWHLMLLGIAETISYC